MSTTVFDPLDPAFLADPYPGYAWLRDHDPVHHHPADHRAPSFWALSRFEHIWDAVRRPEVFSSASGLTFFRDEIGQLGLPPTIVMLDPPVQTRLRALIGRAFTPRHVDPARGRHPGVRARAGSRRWPGVPPTGSTVDLHADYSSAVPTWVLAELFGLPEADRERFGPWVQTLTRLQNDGLRRQRAGRRHRRRPQRRGRGAGDRRDVRVLHRCDRRRARRTPATTCSAGWSRPRSTASD